MIRKLYFQNAAGQRWGLNGENGVYASELSGFGFSLDPSFADLGQGFFSPSSDNSEPQNALAFTVILTRNAYATFQSFSNWLASAGTLSIIYDPTGNREYCRDVSVNYLQKGEKNQVGWLELPCSFFCHTPWYLPSPTSLSMTGAGQDKSKRYPFRYPYRYGYDSTAALTTSIAGAGHIPGAIRLIYRGAITNPQLRLVGRITGKTYGLCNLSVILDEGDALEYSSMYRNSYVKRIRADGQETDLLDALDLTLSPFFHVPVNEPCLLSIEADAPFTGRAELWVYYYYRSV